MAETSVRTSGTNRTLMIGRGLRARAFYSGIPDRRVVRAWDRVLSGGRCSLRTIDLAAIP
jgi:hypothetical protein